MENSCYLEERKRTKSRKHKYQAFPETFSLKNDIEFREYIRVLVVDKIIYKDIPTLFV